MKLPTMPRFGRGFPRNLHLHRRQAKRRLPLRAQLQLEPLEDRWLLSTGLQILPFDPTTTPVSALVGHLLTSNSGLTITDSQFVGVIGQAGTYSGFDLKDASNSLKLPDGILLTNGLISNALPGNDPFGDGTSLGLPGDPRLDQFLKESTFDANVLTLHFTAAPGVKSVLFDFVFGSEEFPFFVGSQFNDAFVAFLDGQQISFDQNMKPITVNNNFFQLDNSGINLGSVTQDKTHVHFDIRYNGLTPHLTTQAELTPAQTEHTLTFIIADAGDHVLDSGVFLAQLRGSTLAVGEAHTGLSSEPPPPPPPAPPLPPPAPKASPVDQTLAIDLASAEEQRRRDSQLAPILLELLQDHDTGALTFPLLESPHKNQGPGDFAIRESGSQALPIGSISGRVFEDYNGDGRQAANEPGLAGQIVYLDLNGNGYLDPNEPQTRTNEKGEYRFLGLTPGIYRVRQVIWNYLEPTQPTSGERVVTLSNERSVVMDQNFGAIQRNLPTRATIVTASAETVPQSILLPELLPMPTETSPGEETGPKAILPLPPERKPQGPSRPMGDPSSPPQTQADQGQAENRSAWHGFLGVLAGVTALAGCFFARSEGRDQRQSRGVPHKS